MADMQVCIDSLLYDSSLYIVRYVSCDSLLCTMHDLCQGAMQWTQATHAVLHSGGGAVFNFTPALPFPSFFSATHFVLQNFFSTKFFPKNFS